MKILSITAIIQLLLLIVACTTTVSGGLLKSLFGKGNDGSEEEGSLDIWDYILEKITGGSYNKKTIFEEDVDDAEIVSAYKDLVDGHLETAATKPPVAMSERTVKQIIREDRRFLLYNSRLLSGECLPICEEPPQTNSPTMRQTGAPTASPTESPTATPTGSPTGSPTAGPTASGGYGGGNGSLGPGCIGFAGCRATAYGRGNGANDSNCGKCATEGYAWDPCNNSQKCEGDLCQNSPNWPGPVCEPNTDNGSSSGGGGDTLCPGCIGFAGCRASEYGRGNGANDSNCGKCATEGYAWDPCNNSQKCEGDLCQNSPNWPGPRCPSSC